MKKTSLEYWERTGLLVNLSQEKKQLIAKLFTYLQNKFGINNKFSLMKSSIDSQPEIIMFPIVRRIGAEIDITKKDVDEMFNDIRHVYGNVKKMCGYLKITDIQELLIGGYDLEMEYVSEYCRTKIIEMAS